MRTTLLLALLALPIFAQNDAPLRALNIEFGIKDSEATQWDGSLSLSRGEIVELRGRVSRVVPQASPEFQEFLVGIRLDESPRTGIDRILALVARYREALRR